MVVAAARVLCKFAVHFTVYVHIILSIHIYIKKNTKTFFALNGNFIFSNVQLLVFTFLHLHHMTGTVHVGVSLS